MLALLWASVAFVGAAALGYLRPRLSTCVLAGLLTVAYYAVTAPCGLRTTCGSYENWGLIVLPAQCAVAAALAGVGVAVRRVSDGRR